MHGGIIESFRISHDFVARGNFDGPITPVQPLAVTALWSQWPVMLFSPKKTRNANKTIKKYKKNALVYYYYKIW